MIRRTVLTLLAALTASAAFAQTNVAVVNFEEVISRSEKARTALGEVGLLRQSKGEELVAMADALKQNQADAQSRAATMTEAERREATLQLQRMDTDLKRATEDADREVQQRANQVLEDLNEDLGPLVAQPIDHGQRAGDPVEVGYLDRRAIQVAVVEEQL